MREKIKYFILNKAYDFNRGIYENMKIDGNTLRFSSTRRSGVGRVVSRIFDSGERGMTWHRLIIRTENCGNEDFKITVYASDSDEIKYNGKFIPLTALLHDTSMSLSNKVKAFAPCAKKSVSGVTDIMLHDISGQYLWIFIETYSVSSAPAAIKNIQIFLPSQSWIDSLPMIYRANDSEHFLERYLGIFQTLYEELDSQIANIADRFDPQCTESEFLGWLCEWLDVSDSELWPEDKLRLLLMTAVDLYRKRGTRESVEKMLNLYLGEKPLIIEEFSIREFKGTDTYENTLLPMYGNDPYRITILIKSDLIHSDGELNMVRRIALEMLPVSTELNLVVLEPYIFLNKFTYLGINSTLGQYRLAALDGKSQLTLSTL